MYKRQIAGTFRRTGNDEKDSALATKLKKDPKENSEHVMLIDLARNDLSRNGSQVIVEKNREIQLFSHVIHLVSKVKCKMTRARGRMSVKESDAAQQRLAKLFPWCLLRDPGRILMRRTRVLGVHISRSSNSGALACTYRQ